MMGYPMDSKSEDAYRAESDLHTLMEAERIKKDKARYQKAMAVAKKKHADLKAVVGDAALGKGALNDQDGDEC